MWNLEDAVGGFELRARWRGLDRRRREVSLKEGGCELGDLSGEHLAWGF